MMRSWFSALVLLGPVLVGIGACPAVAQTPPPPAATAPANEPPAAPYEQQLLRLSEILGALAYLRELCGDQTEGDQLREQMAALIDVEASTPTRKARFAGAYNRGFRGFEQTYRACTPNAELVVSRYLGEGLSIAREVASRYGGGKVKHFISDADTFLAAIDSMAQTGVNLL